MSDKQSNLWNLLSLDVLLMNVPIETCQCLMSHTQPSAYKNPSLHREVLPLQANEFINSDALLLSHLSKRFLWKNNIRTILSTEYEALVLTNIDKKIVWVNQGFEKMTGYSSSFAIGKKPTFLQGKNTSNNTRAIFRQNLQKGTHFCDTLVNYRKNGEEYICQIELFPLQNTAGHITHFLALEQEIR